MVVEQNVRFYARTASLCEGLGKLPRKRTVLVKILSERDCLPRRLDVAQHDGKGFIAVEQDIDTVAGHDRRIRVRFDGWKKCRFAESHGGNLIDGNDFGTAKNQQNREEPFQVLHNYNSEDVFDGNNVGLQAEAASPRSSD